MNTVGIALGCGHYDVHPGFLIRIFVKSMYISKFHTIQKAIDPQYWPEFSL